ncbi:MULTISPECIES: hypothetical protein [Sphingomonas]|uniref:hypothetical protein n=1 Tax=Sphingomonas TaxID=13687 RepID=UPI0013B467D7|nr:MULTISPECIES: hypothetical protein [Sphingomonas]
MTMPMNHSSMQMSPQTQEGAATSPDHSTMQHSMTVQIPAGSSSKMPMPMDHSQMDHSQMDHGSTAQMSMPMNGHGNHMAMNGAFGSYPMERESSGTAWQPDTSEHEGLMAMSGDWTLMAHGVLNLVADHQGGPRGDDKVFPSGMLMGMARRPLGNGTLQFKAMLSPEPIMGPSGYPLLLASGETANGRDRLIDRQHPHDLFMELSASVSQNIGRKSSVFVYAGLPGEPAFGPPAFMHREAIMDSPEAPITHHWLDSTHISFGVFTAGVVLDRFKVEASRFNGREPDEHRWNIETGQLDSTAVRVSWNPTRTLALQGSWGHFVDPEELEPGVNQKRWSASALWAEEVAPGWKIAATLAWGRKTAHGHSDDGYAAEASLKHQQWTVFGRAELTENRELIDVEDGPAYRVGKASLGAVRDFRIADHLSFGVGGLASVNFVPDGLAPLYGRHNPVGTMGFVRLKLN